MSPVEVEIFKLQTSKVPPMDSVGWDYLGHHSHVFLSFLAVFFNAYSSFFILIFYNFLKYLSFYNFSLMFFFLDNLYSIIFSDIIFLLSVTLIFCNFVFFSVLMLILQYFFHGFWFSISSFLKFALHKSLLVKVAISNYYVGRRW